MYLYQLPTTDAISFSTFCVDRSIKKLYTYHIPNVTQERANLHALLKNSKKTDHGERDFLAVIKAINEYLPQLRAIMACVMHDEISLINEPIFSWRTAISSHLFNNSSHLPLASLHADYAFTLLTYAFALSNLARSTIVSLGSYEQDRAISDSDRKAKDEKLNVAVNFLCTASGIFSFVGDTVLLEWETARVGGMSGINRPPELLQETNTALAKLALADAQSLAIRKLLSKAVYDNNIAPGPPLPKSHPSPILIAKLHLECVSLYISARSLVKTVNSSKGSRGEVSGELRSYLADEAALHSALAKKWLGVDAGENGGTSRGGEAVAYLAWAKKELEDLKDGAKGLGLSKEEKEKKSLRKEKLAEELGSVNVFYKHYRKVNDTLHFQPVPSTADLQAHMPTGRLAVSAKVYVAPLPAFGPGSLEHMRLGEADEGVDRHNEEFGEQEGSAPGVSTASYAGAGSYF